MMGQYTVNEVARMAGVSVRTLHHYDAIGLLRPAFIGENRYRFYEEAELLRLQQILVHRELGLSLAEIAIVLDAPDYDRLTALRRQRARIVQARSRYARLLETIDRTIARLEGYEKMKDEDLYSGVVDPERQADYEAWLVERFGPAVEADIARSKANMDGLDEDGVKARMAELQAIEVALADAMRHGVAPQARALDPLLARHRAWIGTMWAKPVTAEVYAGLADLYLAHPDFIARYEQIAPGFSQFLFAAMQSWSRRQ